MSCSASSLGRIAALLLSVALAGCGGGSSDSALAPLPNGVVPRYGQQLHIQVSGAQMDQVEASSSACRTPLLQPSSSPPYVSSASVAHFLCEVSAVGPQTLLVRRRDDQRTVQQYGFEVPLPQVTLDLSNGGGLKTLVLTLRPDRAPLTVDNFLHYVKSGFYLDTVFHRVSAGFVVQGGGYASGITTGSVPVAKATDAPIALESTGLSNVRWSIAMARTTSSPDSATAQFYVNLADNTGLDPAGPGTGYAVFGSVSSGMAVIDALADPVATPCAPVAGFVSGTLGCVPIPNVVIVDAQQTR